MIFPLSLSISLSLYVYRFSVIQTIIQYGCSCALPCCQTFLHTDYSTATAILKAITSYNNGTLFQVASKRRERFASSFLSHFAFIFFFCCFSSILFPGEISFSKDLLESKQNGRRSRRTDSYRMDKNWFNKIELFFLYKEDMFCISGAVMMVVVVSS